MMKVAAGALVLVLLVGSGAVFLWMREAECQRELIDKVPQINQIIRLVAAQSRSEVERLFLSEVAGNATYKTFAHGDPPGSLISNAGSGTGTNHPGYLGANSEEWFIKWSTPYPECDYSKLPVTGGFVRVYVDVKWVRDWKFIPMHPRVEIADYSYPQNAFLIAHLTRELDALGLPHRVRVITRGK